MLQSLSYQHRLLLQSMRYRMDAASLPDTYIVDLYPDPLILDVWQNQRRYGRFVVEDVWSFVPALYREVRHEEMAGFDA